MLVMRKVAERCFVSSVDIIHAAAATCSCMWSDPLLPIIRCSVVGSVSVLAISSPGGGLDCSMSSAKLVGLCVHTSCPICWYVMGWLLRGSDVVVPVAW